MSALYLDIGNSRLKWAYRKSPQQWLIGVCNHDAFFSLSWPQALTQLIVASVRDQPLLKQRLLDSYGENLCWLSQPLADFPHFNHCYPNPQRLGVDRWLAMLGAQTLCGDDVLVIDAGTALTLDLLDKQQQHQGGWIVPGVQLAQQSLFQQTQRVNDYADEEGAVHHLPGRDTLGCVTSGVRRQMVAMASSVASDYPEHKVFVCGGDGEWLAGELQQIRPERDIIYAPELIFNGMESLCAGSFLP